MTAISALVGFAFTLCGQTDDGRFPAELVRFENVGAPVFRAEPGKWDARIRERGWILREGGLYHLWYTGYVEGKTTRRMLGYATSRDGSNWLRHPQNPIHRQDWVEDMMIVKDGGVYHMFAEGENDIAHYLTSTDRIHWTRLGPLDVRYVNGKPLSAGPYGTPTVWLENGIWHLFYERGDQGVWLAKSQDRKVWINVSDEPVLRRGPEAYDKFAVALNQIVKHKGRYYAYYHGTDTPRPQKWSTSVATSIDLIHWEKYPGNPLVKNNESSGIVVPTEHGFALYTMHDVVRLHAPLN